jgi:hypothetical protein
MEASVISTLFSLAAKAIANAIYATGPGSLELAEGDLPGAASAFAAAAEFGAIGGAEAFAARAIPGGSFPASSGSAAGRGGA